MAKKPVKVSLNTALLAQIASGAVTRIGKDDATPLLGHNPQLIEVDTTAIDATNTAPVRLTEAGVALVAAANAPAAVNGEAKASAYAVITNAILPPSKRGNRKGGGAPIKYPFDSMEVGHSFFVPVSEEHADPVKTLGSTVSSANMRFAEDTGTTKTVTRTKRGEKNKALLDAAGNKIKETVEVPVYKHTRRFSIRAVEAGKQYGDWVAPADGALIARVAIDDTK